MFRIIIVALLVATGMAFQVQANDSVVQQSEPFTQLLEKLRQHPEVAAYASKADATEHYAKGELGLPDPMLNVQEKDFPIGSSMSQDFEEKMIGFKQEIPAFGTRSAKAEGRQAEAHKTRLMGDFAFATMKAKLIMVLANAERIRAQEKILDEQSRIFASERASIKGHIAANQASVSQYSMSQADSTEIDLMRAELSEQKHETHAMLANMVGEVSDIAPPQVTLATWDRDSDKTYPARIAAEDIAVAHKEVAMREAEFGPSFEVSVDYGRMNNRDNAGTIMVGVSIPLWSSESQKPKLAGAKASVTSAQLEQQSAKRDITQKLDHLRAQIETSGRKITLLASKEKQLAQGARAITREYESGKADVPMALKAKRDALSTRFALVAEKAKHTGLIAEFNSYIVGDAQ